MPDSKTACVVCGYVSEYMYPMIATSEMDVPVCVGMVKYVDSPCYAMLSKARAVVHGVKAPSIIIRDLWGRPGCG